MFVLYRENHISKIFIEVDGKPLVPFIVIGINSTNKL